MCWIVTLDYTEPSLLRFCSLGFHDTTVSLFSSHLLYHFFSTCPLNTDIFQGSKFDFLLICLLACQFHCLPRWVYDPELTAPALVSLLYSSLPLLSQMPECPTNIWNSTYMKLNTYISFRNLLLLLSSLCPYLTNQKCTSAFGNVSFLNLKHTHAYTHIKILARLLQSVWSVFKGPRKGRNPIPLFLYLKADSVPFQWDLPFYL